MQMQIDIGIRESERKRIAEGLGKLLADSYTLYLKTHNYHWNVVGPMFPALHTMFETQYMDLALAVDLIAERIRALGMHAPGSYTAFAGLSSIKEDTADTPPPALEMVKRLVEGHEAVIRTARSLVPLVNEVADEATMDLLTERMQHHEKTAWMLRSLLER